MAGRKWSILVAFFILLISMEAVIAQGQGNGNGNGNDNGNNGNGNGNNGNNGNGKGNDKDEGKDKDKDDKDKGKGKGKKDDDSSKYESLPALQSGQERGFCQAQNTCHFKTLVCPEECKQRKPKKNKKDKGCFIDCNKCEATCKCKFTSIYIYIWIFSIILDLYRWIKIRRCMVQLYILDLTYVSHLIL
jgi:hypothetical protein